MKRNRTITLMLILLFAASGLMAQKPYPEKYFRSPIDFPIQLAGSFGDIRPNHFHSGIDIRTEGVTGKPVYAAADGYISRIFVSPYGFGKALYITHPNGYTTVYGHLDGFNKVIRSWIHAKQYSRESFEIDTPVDTGILPVKKGELIAWSGNSGTSGGPHLHFEIRDSPTQETINPVLFGLPVKDNLPPVISSVRIYPFDEMAMINFVNAPVSLFAEGRGGSWSLKVKDTILVTGNIYFGIEVLDPSDAGNIKSGITSIEMYIDTVKYYSQALKRFSFSMTRYVNAAVDYSLLKSGDRKIQRSYIARNNKLGIYSNVLNRGIINFSDNAVHRIRYVVKDAFGNTSSISFQVKSHLPAQGRHPLEKQITGTPFQCDRENTFSTPGCRLIIPADALYDDIDFTWSRSDSVNTGYNSAVFSLHNELTPLQKPCTLSIKPGKLPAGLQNKAVIVRINNRMLNECMGGEWNDGTVTASVREFGNYAVRVDTMPPVIRAINLYPGKNVSKQNSIRVKISDNLSGIKYYRGTLNGKWILMDYDAKNSLLEYRFDDRIRTGKNDFRLVVRDGTGNQSEYQATITR